MERFTISLDSELAKEFDALIAERGYGNRSEAVRDIIRGQLEAWRLAHDEAPHCVANLSYVYNHHERDLAERGVRHGKLNLVAVEIDQRHAHGYKPRSHGGNQHVHLKPAR